MKSRSLLMLGLGAALVLGPSSVASAQNALDMTEMAALTVENPKVKQITKNKAAQSGSKAGSKSTDRNKVSAKSTKDAAKQAETGTPRPKNLFSAIFGSTRRVEPAPQASQQRNRQSSQRQLTLKERRGAEGATVAVANQPVQSIVATGNNGELRSELVQQRQQDPLFASLFGGKPRQPQQPQLLPETRALDAALAAKDARRPFKVKADFEPQVVNFGGYPRGTIVIDTSARYLYLVETSTTARRYAIAVGRQGLEFKGKATVGDKQEWPRWIPTADMQKREPKKYGQYKDGMPGGPNNPLGARAIYLYQGKMDTHIRIHGTNQPQTIGTNSSNGCFRMVNEHVQDLYGRVGVGAEVIVM